MVNFL